MTDKSVEMAIALALIGLAPPLPINIHRESGVIVCNACL
jgi:hypothetical protein